MKLRDPRLLQPLCYIDGAWRSAYSGDYDAVVNPATGVELARVPNCGASEARAAIDAAHRAFPAWAALTAAARGARLRRWYELLLENVEDLALILTSEQGKPLAEAQGEIRYAAAYIEWFAEEAKRNYGDVIPAPTSDKRLIVIRQPVGVVATITPWNFPAAMITRKVAAALAAGCTVVSKPAPQTPLSAFALAVLAERAGLPAGVFNVLSGDAAAIGGEFTSDVRVRKLSFTGSTAVGRKLMAQCAPQLKKVSLELGGNAPFLVFDDADIDAAVQGAVASKFRNAGQTCVCTNRFLIQSGIYDAFAARLAAAVAQLRIGDGLQPGSEQGPLINQAALEKVEGHVADAIAKGGRIIQGGHRHVLGGTFHEPTVICDATPAMRVASEETFGPLAALFRFDTEEQALRLANDTEYGLAAYVYTRDLARAWRVGEALESGMVGINTGLISSELAPFGGIKASGMGREGSKYGLQDYTELKYLCLGGM